MRIEFLVPACGKKATLVFWKDGKKVSTEKPWPGGFLQYGFWDCDAITFSEPFKQSMLLWAQKKEAADKTGALYNPAFFGAGCNYYTC